jgi:putative ABC transport system substrate-binding protein
MDMAFKTHEAMTPRIRGTTGLGRRQFITLLGGAAAAWPVAARGQQPVRVWRVGFLTPVPPTFAMLRALASGLRDHGLIEGQNLAMQVRWPDGPFEEAVADLIAGKVDVIVAWTSPSVIAARNITSTIPIVMTSVGDPVEPGFVQSLARPGGNITGVSNVAHDLNGKIVELLLETFPRVRRVGVLHNPRNPGLTAQLRQTEQAIRALKLELEMVEADTPEQVERAMQDLKRSGVHAVIFLPDPTVIGYRRRIAEFAMQTGWPTAFQRQENVEAGGLLSYGASLTDQLRQSAIYVDRILKGAKPSDLPVQQPIKFELAINLKTAKVLGLEVPSTLLARADEVIE